MEKSFCNDPKNREARRKQCAGKRGKDGVQDLYHSRIVSFERVFACNFFAFPQDLAIERKVAVVSRWRFISGMGRIYCVNSRTN